MKVYGYKAFNKSLTNNYGKKFEEKENYHIDGDIKFGINGCGFHFAKNISDVFRYINDKENVVVAEVYGYGKVLSYDDEYNGYYDMYVASDICIERILKRNEIISKVVNAGELSFKKFIMTGFSLNEEELKDLNKYITPDIQKYIDFYYYKKDYKEVFDINKKLVLKK